MSNISYDLWKPMTVCPISRMNQVLMVDPDSDNGVRWVDPPDTPDNEGRCSYCGSKTNGDRCDSCGAPV